MEVIIMPSLKGLAYVVHEKRYSLKGLAYVVHEKRYVLKA